MKLLSSSYNDPTLENALNKFNLTYTQTQTFSDFTIIAIACTHTKSTKLPFSLHARLMCCLLPSPMMGPEPTFRRHAMSPSLELLMSSKIWSIVGVADSPRSIYKCIFPAKAAFLTNFVRTCISRFCEKATYEAYTTLLTAEIDLYEKLRDLN